MDAFDHSTMSEQMRDDNDGGAVSANDVNLDLDRAGSPVQHRRHRLRGPIIDDEDGGMASLLPPAAHVPQATVVKADSTRLVGVLSGSSSVGADEDIAFSLQPSSDDDGEGPLGSSVDAAGSGAGHFRPHHVSSDDELRPIADTSLPASLADAAMLSAEHAMASLENGESSNAVRDATRAPVSSLYNSMMGVSDASVGPARRGDDETPSCDGAFSPAPVTVLGVAHDLRRKRVKKVSHYILGPLLGEGSYGVVRDAINVSADQKRFSRCAIKMLASGLTASGLVGPGTDATQSSADALAGESSRGGRRGGRGRRRGGDAEAAQATNSTMSRTNTTAVANAETAAVGGGAAEASSSQSAGLSPAEEDRAAATAEAVGERLAPWNGKGLVRGSDARKAQEQAIFRNEINNLQRFHCKNVIRAIDVFSRYGKAYVVMPIAICSLQQFVRESIRLMREQQHVLNRANGADGAHDDSTEKSVGTLLKPLPSHVITIRDGDDDGSGAGGADEQTSSDRAALSSSGPVSGSATSTLSIARRLVQEEWNPAQHYLRDGALFSPILTKGFMYQLLAGIEYLHQQHIAHNDIKPSNLLLFEDGSVKLTDLGSVGATYAGQGTPLYASPELCKCYYGMEDDAVEAQEKKEDTANSERVEQDDDAQNNTNNQQQQQDESSPAPASGVNNNSNTPTSSSDFSLFANDMWCCGLVFYYLITGRPGPLPVHTLYHQYHEAHRQMEEEGALHPAFHMTRWSLYREIAMQKVPVDLDNVPDMIVEPTSSAMANTAAADKQGPSEAGEAAVASCENKASAESDSAAAATARPAVSRYPPNGARDLLSKLLELDPAKRITAEAALQHPWVRMTFKPSKKKKEEKSPDAASAPNTTTTTTTTTDAATTGDGDDAKDGATTSLKKPPSKRAMEDAIQRDVARRVLQSRHVKALTLLDRQRHLQFAADCCQILGVPLPPEILRERGTEPFEDEAHLDIALLPAAASSGQRDDGRGGSVTGTVVTYGAPEVMPEGTVDTNLFLPPEEYDYYEQKCGKNEFDVVVLRNQPAKVRQMEEYMHNVVLVQCGYRTREDPMFATNNRGTAPKALLTKMASGTANAVQPMPTSSSSSTLVIRPGGGSLSAGVGVAGTSVFSTNSSTLNQLQQQQRKHTDSVTVTTLSPASLASLSQSGTRAALSSREPAAAGVVARDDSSHESNPELPGHTAPPQSTTSAVTPIHTGSTARTPAQRARQSARLSEAEAVVAAQEGRTAIQESSKCLCGLM